MGNFGVVTKGMFRQARQSGRVVMGYLLGLAIMGYWMSGFFQYVADTGEPINILETFCVVEQHYVNLLFLLLGWLLVIADAPFVKGNTYLLLYRFGRRRWNAGMLFYILVQAFSYVAVMAIFTIMISSFYGFTGNMWSSPVYSLAKDVGNNIGVKYNISFPWLTMMQVMTVPQAFAVTVLFLYLYLALLGVLLYVAALLISGTAGIATVMAVHLIGYLQMMDGHAAFSLLARAVPGNFIDGTGACWRSAALFLVWIILLIILSDILVKKVEFHSGAEVDG